MKLRGYLLLLLALAGMPVVVVTGLSLRTLGEAERESARHAVRVSANALAGDFEREFATSRTALEVLAAAPALATDDYPTFHAQALRSATDAEQWVVLTDPKGRQLVNTRVPHGSALPPMPVDQVTRALRARAPVVSDHPAPDGETGVEIAPPVYTLDLPVTQSDGRGRLLTQVFTPRALAQVMDRRELRPTWIAAVLDSQGVTIAHSRRPELVGQRASDAFLDATIRARIDGDALTKAVDGTDVYAAFTRVPGSGWTVVVAVPASELEAPVRLALRTAVGGLLVSLAIAGALALFVARRLDRGIRDAMRAAVRLGRGEPPGQAPISRVREIGQLQRAVMDAAALLDEQRRERDRAKMQVDSLLASETGARQLAEQQSRSKDEFLAMLAHELRNPLSAITGAAAVLQRSPAMEPPARQRLQDIIERQCRHLAKIVEDLLDVSRVFTGKIVLHRAPIDLQQTVAGAVATLHAAGRVDPARLTVEARPTWVEADPTRLDQVVTNLLVNAFKYTPEDGHVHVTVTADGDTAVLAVADNGIGISPALAQRLFEPFVQGPAASLARSEGGLGIGLALVRRLVRMHGGDVVLHSDGEGRGSRFTVTLPRVSAPQLVWPPTPDAAVHPALTLLLVDDHDDGRTSLAELLEAQGHRVLQAGDGVHGLEIARATPPDAAVVDIGLPGIDGYEVARRMRMQSDGRPLVLVALTGYGTDADRRQAFDAGFDDHLTKPAEASEVMGVIRRLMARVSAA